MLGLRPGRREAQVTFDWFKNYEDVAHLLRPLLPDKDVLILILGCGNSTLSEDVCVPAINIVSLLSTFLEHLLLIVTQMYDEGYKNIVNVDVRLCCAIVTNCMISDGLFLIRSTPPLWSSR